MTSVICLILCETNKVFFHLLMQNYDFGGIKQTKARF
jgi:hypothetical protein